MRDHGLTKLLASVGLWSQSRHQRILPANTVESTTVDGSVVVGSATEPLLATLDAIPQLIWISDCTGKLSYVNRSWTDYTGIDKSQAAAMTWFDVLHPDDVGSREQAWNDAVSGRAFFQAQARMRGRGGGYRWHFCRAAPHFDEERELHVWFGTFTDCDELKRALQARDDAISAVSHELRSPLTALKLRLDALLHQGTNDRKLQERVQSAISQALRLEKLIDDLLDFSHLLEGRMALCQERVELCECTSRLIERILPAIVEHGASVELSCASPAHGYWDRARLEQVIASILLSTARHASGSPIRIHVDSDDRLATLTVQDCGTEAVSREQGHALERDTRASSADLGELEIGLYLVREIIIAHGGSIRVDTRSGRGTAYTVELPKKSAAASTHETLQQSKEV